MKTRLGVFLFILALLAGCIAAPTPEPTPTAQPPYRITPDENLFAPQLKDSGWQIAAVKLTSVGFSERYDFSPPRAVISFVGYIPSVCNELRIEISEPDREYNVFVEVYSLVNPDIQCDSVFQQFETNILLGTYSTGRYSVWVNGTLSGDFVSY
ncbi:hypothetical protein MASR2M66_28500 [Chloroflexota bacterium]